MKKENNVKSCENANIENFCRLGGTINVSPKSHVQLNKEGFKKEFFVKTILICIGIGKDHTADLVMDVEAWKALMSGEKVHITTTKEYEKKYGKYRPQKKATISR